MSEQKPHSRRNTYGGTQEEAKQLKQVNEAVSLSGPRPPAQTRRQSLESAKKIDMKQLSKTIQDLKQSEEKECDAKKATPPPQSIVWQGKLFYYIGPKPIRAQDWRAAWVTLQDHRLVGVAIEDPTKQVLSWSVCVGCQVEKSEDISKKGDRSKWGYVFSLECSQSGSEMYFVAETDEKGQNWVQKIYDARHLTHWLAPWERDDLPAATVEQGTGVEGFSLLDS
eukprot:TRINITY_DN7932_c0_g3_i2.p1 TRINITY_DN7932_c0_g3~~TRINITY_DN7932_c0_g3_i2.p1  ORF type:complete len:224 (-),score=46.36 TRINITY_DN7932_c0_g3_i2:150-821(-)